MSQSSYLTDHATQDDLLDYEHFQQVLYNVVTKAETPLTIGVFGPWGSGKTSLMKMLRHQLEQEKIDSRRTVWFTAWKYDRQDALWRSFILRVLDALYPRETEPKDAPREERPILQNPTDPKQKRRIELLNRLEESVYQAVDWDEIGPRAINWWQFISNTGKAGVETAAHLGSAGLTRSYNRRQLHHMEEFEAIFKEVIALLPKGNGRLIVFVDDLDRCLPEKAIEVLEAIKLFLEVTGVVFVLGMDQSVVRQGIEARYATAFRYQLGKERIELPIQGDSYLQKIVQIPFHLPAMATMDVAGFVDKLNPNLSPVARAVLAQGVYPNPRQVKRVLNILLLLREIADLRFAAEEIVDSLLVKTVIIQSQYPALYQLWRQYPTLVVTLEEEYARHPTSESEVLTGIMLEGVRKEDDANSETAAGKGADGQVDRKAGRGGLLQDYFEDRFKYAFLERLMTYEPDETINGQGERVHFKGLDREQIHAYVRLAGAVESDPTAVPVAIDEDLKAGLLSGETVRIRDAASRLQSEEAEADKPIHQPLRQELVGILSNPQQPREQRMSAGDALAHIGDPRFHDENRFFLPNDEMLGFVEIPAGPFYMGSDPEQDPEAEEREQPQHTLNLEKFYMARYPVTVAQFKLFVKRSGYKPAREDSLKGLVNHPVRRVTWYDAIAYCKWLAHRLREQETTLLATLLWDGYTVTLPSEAEWEKAARGTDSRIYPWDNTFDEDRANHKGLALQTTSAVGSFPGGESGYKLLDMGGNVWEWTRSIWGDSAQPSFGYPYDQNDGRENLNKGDNWFRVLRGGGFYDDNKALRCTSRLKGRPVDWSDNIGIRVCVSPFATR
jgi:formylglycine-generating enzyme required for sulfatase activity/GTPase SAR1 family protein